jgi:hypothetical protein
MICRHNGNQEDTALMQGDSQLCGPGWGAALHGDRCTIGSEPHIECAAESVMKLLQFAGHKIRQNAIPLHADIRHTGRRDSDLSSEKVL